MKHVQCDLCDTKTGMMTVDEISGWFLATNEDQSDLCPDCYEELFNFMTKVRNNYVRVKRKKRGVDKSSVVNLKVH